MAKDRSPDRPTAVPEAATKTQPGPKSTPDERHGLEVSGRIGARPRADHRNPDTGEYRDQGDRNNGGAPRSDASHRTLCVGHLSDRRSRRASRRVGCHDELMAARTVRGPSVNSARQDTMRDYRQAQQILLG
jgi:hypothetical protein